MGNGFFQSTNGNNSSTRLIGFVVIVAALLMAEQIIYYGRNSENLLMIATAAGTLFDMIAGGAMLWMFGQKKTEVKYGEPKKEKNKEDGDNIGPSGNS